MQHLERISSDPQKRKEYEQRINEFRDENAILKAAKQKGEEIGQKKGEKKKAEEIAKKLLNIGLADDQISESTGLTIEEIRSLRN